MALSTALRSMEAFSSSSMALPPRMRMNGNTPRIWPMWMWDILILHIDRSWKYQPTQENWTIPDVTRNYGYKLNDAWQLDFLAAGRAIPTDKERFKLPAKNDGKLAHQNFKNAHTPWNVYLSVKFSECFCIVAWYSSFRWLKKVAFHVMASFSIAPGQGLYVVRSLIHLGMVTIAPIAHPIIYGDLHGDSLWQFTISQPVTGPAGKGHCSSRAAFALLQRLCLPFVQGDLRHQHRPFLGTKKRKMWDFRSELVGRMNCMNYGQVIWAAALICVYGKYYSGVPRFIKSIIFSL